MGELLYSIKANPHPAIVRRCVKQGLSLEVSSVGELEVALDCCDGETRIVCTGPGKSDDYLSRAARVRAIISVESEDEIRRLNRLGKSNATDVLVRVNANTQARNASLQMTGVASQFGIDEGRAELAIQAIRRGPHRFRGVHLYMGSNVDNEDDLVQQYRIGMTIAKRLAPYAEADFIVDLGGGFGHPFARPGATEVVPVLRTGG